MDRISIFFGIVLIVSSVWGCSGKPPRMQAPAWDPEGMAKAAVDSADKNNDRALSAAELVTFPGLLARLKILDENKNGSIEESELVARLQLYKEMRTAYRPKTIQVTYKGQPLANAKVQLIPEPFVASVLEPAEGITDGSGTASMKATSMDVAVMRLGFYQVQISSDTVKLPEKFNSKTTLGLEASPVSDGEGSPDVVRFDLQ